MLNTAKFGPARWPSDAKLMAIVTASGETSRKTPSNVLIVIAVLDEHSIRAHMVVLL
jgi:hypothetical protein